MGHDINYKNSNHEFYGYRCDCNENHREDGFNKEKKDCYNVIFRFSIMYKMFNVVVLAIFVKDVPAVHMLRVGLRCFGSRVILHLKFKCFEK
jgi:hypothetical protein